MPIIGNGNAVDDMCRIAFGNRAFVMAFDGTTTKVTNAGNRDPFHREMRCADTLHFTAV